MKMNESIFASVLASTLMAIAYYKVNKACEKKLGEQIAEPSEDDEKLAEAISKEFQQEPSRFFDCPVCSFPCEVRAVMAWSDMRGIDAIYYLILNCLGDHETVTVTQDWFLKNVLEYEL
jgi:hypothetical protein